MNRVRQMIHTVGRTPLLGVAVHSYNTAFIEMAAHVGFNAVWLEMEHMPNSVREVCDMCRIASGLGMLTMIRIPDARRDSVLKAAECGPDIIDLPMGNSPEMLRELVKHARYAPEGERGFFSASRATNYGMVDSIAEQHRRINRGLCLMSQVETQEALARLDDICAVPGIDALFIGPGDLSVSFGIPGDINGNVVMTAIERVIQTAKRCGKIVALAHSVANAATWARLGVDLLFCCSDVGCMGIGLRSVMDQAKIWKEMEQSELLNPENPKPLVVEK